MLFIYKKLFLINFQICSDEEDIDLRNIKDVFIYLNTIYIYTNMLGCPINSSPRFLAKKRFHKIARYSKLVNFWVFLLCLKSNYCIQPVEEVEIVNCLIL